MSIDFKFKSSLEKVYIIAEIGVNHNGELDLAKKMIIEAKNAGANAVKFQTYITEKLCNKSTPKVAYQINNEKSESHYEMLKKLELSKNDHFQIKSFCDDNDITFLSTPYDLESAKFLNEDLNVSLFKTASADIVDIPLQDYIASTQKPCFISTGMSNISEIETIYEIYKKSNNHQFAFLHCVSNYPCSIKSLNLKVISSLANYFNVIVGFSDHSYGYEASLASIALGAKIIEKHFTLDKSLKGPDHKASAEPKEFQELVEQIRKVETMLGDPYKKVQEEENEMYKVSRKSLHLKSNIKMNQKIKDGDLFLQRPGDGLNYNFLKYLVGKQVKRDLNKGHKINFEDIF